MEEKPVSLANHYASKVLRRSSEPKKQQEELVIRGFLGRLALSEFEIEARERPDFLVAQNSGAAIATELAHYFSDAGPSGSQDARFFRLWNDFALDLRTRLVDNGLDHLYGAIHFRDPNRAALPPTELFIGEIVRALRSRDGNELRNFDPAIFPIMASVVDHVYVRDTSPEKGILWWCAHLQSGSIERIPRNPVAADRE